MRKYPIRFWSSSISKSKSVYNFPNLFKIKNIPKEYTRNDPYKKGFMKYESKENSLEMNYETKSFEYKIPVVDFEKFKNSALEIQKYEASVKNVIFEKKTRK